ncbi:hypothetical protein GCM10009718_36860 [Isoptericola halotolerans]
MADLLADDHDRAHVATVAADMLKRGIVTVTELDGTLDEITLEWGIGRLAPVSAARPSVRT